MTAIDNVYFVDNLNKEQYTVVANNLKIFNNVELINILLIIKEVIVVLGTIDGKYIVCFYDLKKIFKWEHACINWRYIEDIEEITLEKFTSITRLSSIISNKEEQIQIYNNFANSNKLKTIQMLL